MVPTRAPGGQYGPEQVLRVVRCDDENVVRGLVCGIAFGWDPGDPETLGLQSFEKSGFVGEALFLDELERLVIRSASKCRRQILEGERCCVLALQEGDEVPRRKNRPSPLLLLHSHPCFLYTANRVACLACSQRFTFI